MEGYAKKQLFIVLLLYVGELSVGYLSGWAAPAIPKLQNPQESPLSSAITDQQAMLIGPVSYIGVIIGAHISGFLSNMSGRKPSLLQGGITLMAAYLLLAASSELWMLIVGRLLVGVGAGMVYIVNLAYIAEISSTNLRGIFLTGTGILNACGNMLGYCVGPYVTFRPLCYVGFFLAMTCTAGALFIPESPVFYVMKEKEFEAKTTLVRLGRSSDVEEVLSCKTTTTRRQEWMSIISLKSNRKAMLIATVLLVSQQASGYTVVILFGTTVFQSVATSISPATATILLGSTQVVASCITPMFVERLGRKALMLLTTAACFFSHIILGAYFCLESLNPDLARHVHWLPLLSFVVFLMSYTAGFGIIPGTWMSEMFDSSARAPGSASAMTISWIFAFLTASTYAYMTSTLGRHVTFWIYSLSCALAFIFSSLVVPETKGKSLAEIQFLLSK